MTFLEGVEIKAICDIVRFRIDETTQLFKEGERIARAPGLYRKWGCLEKSV
jgi:DNA polymerase III delta prime subunit